MSQNQPQIQNPPGTGRRSRRRNRGGSNQTMIDANPQFLNATVVESAANTYTEKAIPTPVVMTLSNGRALVMELLKVYIVHDAPELIAATYTSVYMSLCTRSRTSIASLHDPEVITFDRVTLQAVGARTAEATGLVQPLGMKVVDLTDGNGNGVLVANANLFLGVKGSNNVGVKNASLKILYRLKQVNANELVGMIRE